MSSYIVTLLGKKDIAKNTFSCELSIPKNFTYMAGQYAKFTVLKPAYNDEKGAMRAMSFASAPHEETLCIAMRNSGSAFKKSLCALNVGDSLRMEGPLGKLVLDSSDTPVVCIAGGIGITPFRSIIFSEEKKGFPRHITLLYSNCSPREAAFYDELTSIHHDNLSVVSTMTDLHKDATWEGECKKIDKEMIDRYVHDVSSAFFYLCGSTGMVIAMKNILEEMGVPTERLRMELFGV